MTPVFLTCALVGNFSTRQQNENLPITPEELATQALEAAKAGAAIVHVHVRDPATELPSMDFTTSPSYLSSDRTRAWR